MNDRQGQSGAHHDDHFIDEHLKALQKAMKKEQVAEEARAYNLKQLEKIKEAREKYDLFEAVRSTLRQIGQFGGFMLKTTGQFFPPLNVVISGFGIILDLVENGFISKEKLNRRAVRMINGVISAAAGIASFVLAFNPLTAPVGAALVCGASAVSVVKECIFLYKSSRDLRLAKAKLAKLEQSGQKHGIKTCEDEIAKLERERQESRKSVFDSAVTFVGSALAVVVAFAMIGAMAVSPFGLAFMGATAFMLATLLVVKSVADKLYPQKEETRVIKGAGKSTEKDLQSSKNDRQFDHHDHNTHDIAKGLSEKAHISENALLHANIDTPTDPTAAAHETPSLVATAEIVETPKPEEDDDSERDARKLSKQ